MDVTIYKITNTINGRTYVGATTGTKNRFADHLQHARRGTVSPLYDDMRKYGEGAFKFEEIVTVPEENAHPVEIFWIKALGAITSQGGYNRRLDGWNAALWRPLRGKHLSQETREKLSLAVRSDWARRKNLASELDHNNGLRLIGRLEREHGA